MATMARAGLRQTDGAVLAHECPGEGTMNTMQRPVENFQRAAIERGIREWRISSCSLCGYRTGFIIEGEGVLFDAGCGCSWRGPEPASWERLAEHYNRNQPDRNPQAEGKAWLAEMQAFWGFDA